MRARGTGSDTVEAELNRRREDPPDADLASAERSGEATPAFLLPESSGPDARDRFQPVWEHGPEDWREDADLRIGEQRYGARAPGAPREDNPCALRIRLPEKASAERTADAAHDAPIWVRGSYQFVPRADGDGFCAMPRHTASPVGTIRQTPRRIECRRADAWNTLLAYAERESGTPDLEDEATQGHALAAAALVFAAPWPQGPPRVRVEPEPSGRNADTPASRGSTTTRRCR